MSNFDNIIIVSSYDDGYTVSIQYTNARLIVEVGEPLVFEGDHSKLQYLCNLYGVFREQGGNALAARVTNDGNTLILCEDGYIDVWEAIT